MVLTKLCNAPLGLAIAKCSHKKQLSEKKVAGLFFCYFQKELGGGTGELKLRKVYDKFLGKFPWLAKVISFARFVAMVRKALTEMENMLSENKAAKAYVEGSDTSNDSIHAVGVPREHFDDIGVLGDISRECIPGVHAQGMSIATGSYAPASGSYAPASGSYSPVSKAEGK